MEKNTLNEVDFVISNSAVYGLISQTEFFDKDIANSDNTNKYYVINKGDFVYNPRKSIYAPYGPINILEKYDKGIVSPLYTCFKIYDKYSIFLKWYFKTSKWHRYIYINGDQGARGDRVSIKENTFYKMYIYLPSKTEIDKIVLFLDLIQKKTDILKSKINILKKYKKGVFLDTRKCSRKIALKTILSEVNIKTNYNNQYEILSSTAIGLFSQKEYFKHQVASENNVGYKVIKKGQLLFSPQNLWLGNINLNNDFEIGMVSPSYKIYDIDNTINSSWLISMLKSQNMLYKYKQISEQGASVVRRNLDLSQFLEITLDIPDNQIQIGIALETIDKKINALSNLLMNLKNLKMHLLNEMFI